MEISVAVLAVGILVGIALGIIVGVMWSIKTLEDIFKEIYGRKDDDSTAN